MFIDNNQTSIRVLMVIGQFDPIIGGAERQAKQLSQYLLKSGVKVCILTQYIPGHPEIENIDGLTVYRKIKAMSWKRLWGISYILSVLWFLIRNRSRYDIVHCHQLDLHSLAAVIGRSVTGKKVIGKVVCGNAYNDIKRLQNLRFLGRTVSLLKKMDRFIAISDEIEEELTANGFEKSKIARIPNGVNVNHFCPSMEKRSTVKVNITCVARLEERKGIHHLLASLPIVQKSRSDFILTIVGDGPSKEQLISLAHSLDLLKFVQFVGETPNVFKYYHTADIFVLPSASEGMSNVLLEAMACGLPIVATEIGGNVDLIQHGHTGLLVPLNDPKALAEAILRLLQNPKMAQELGQNARKKVENEYSFERVVDRYIDLYKELCWGKVA